MRRKRKVFYSVVPEDDWWWVPSKRKWMKDSTGFAASNLRPCRTFSKAIRAARRVPTGKVVIGQIFWKKGHRYVREYIYEKKVRLPNQDHNSTIENG
jgi:hypothetical protein